MESEDSKLGREVITSGLLRPLREQLGLSRTQMADHLNLNIATYRKWEDRTDVRMWTSLAERLGRFYRSATRQVEILSGGGVNIRELEPFYELAARRGLTQEGLLHMYRNGEINGVDLGVLGLWAYRETPTPVE
jgi:transcriptional regulator with XRE-family HTH domain